MKFDVVIVGGGLVGMGMALALKESGLQLALVEPRSITPAGARSDSDWDSRVYAVSPGSAAFLESLGVWQALDATRVTPVYEMAISGDDKTTQLDFSAYDSGLPELAFIVENRQLQAAMWNALKQQSNVTIFCPVQCDSITWDEAHAELHLADGKSLQAALIVGADGLDSWVRKQAGIEENKRELSLRNVPTNKSEWWRISARNNLTATLPTSGFSRMACWHCCRCRTNGYPWSGRRMKKKPMRCSPCRQRNYANRWPQRLVTHWVNCNSSLRPLPFHCISYA